MHDCHAASPHLLVGPIPHASQTRLVWSYQPNLLSWSDPSEVLHLRNDYNVTCVAKTPGICLWLICKCAYIRTFFGSPNKGPARTYLRTWPDAGRHTNGRPYPERVNNCINMQPWYLEDFLRFLSWKRDAREQDVTRNMSKMALL